MNTDSIDFNGKQQFGGNENIVIKEIKKQSVQLQNFKFPVRVGSKKHQFKRQSWILPEGQTVLEKSPYIDQRRKIHSIEPNVILYFDIFLALKQLLRDSLSFLEEKRQEIDDRNIKESYNLLYRRVIAKKKKVNDLLELYIHQQHMRHGAITLLKSLQQTRTLTKHTTVSQKQISECAIQRDKNIKRLIAIQTELNDMSGTFQFHVLGLVGFSRLVPGDVFEISFKHTEQKNKSKCKITALGQNWTNSVFQFKGNLSEDIFLKILEKGNTIGSVVCALQEFASSKPQVYIIPLNTNGTIKLKLGASWSPMDSSDVRYVDKNNFKFSYQSSDFTKAPVINIITASQKKRDGGNIGSSNFLPYNSPRSPASPRLPRSPASPLVIRSQSPITTPKTPKTPVSPVTKLNIKSQGSSSSFTDTPPIPKQFIKPPASGSPKYQKNLKHLKSRSFDYYEHNSSNQNNLSTSSENQPSPFSKSFGSGQPNPFTPSLFNSFNVSPFEKSSSTSFDTSSHAKLIFDFNIPDDQKYFQKTKTPSYRKISHDESYTKKQYDDFVIPRSNSDSNNDIKNEVRLTRVPVQANTPSPKKEMYSPNILPQKNKPNGHVTTENHTTPKKIPPPVKPKPQRKSSSSAPSIGEDIMLNDHMAVEKMIELCETIMKKLNRQEVIKRNIQALQPKLQEIIEFLNIKTSLKRTPSFTESISSALDSFNFLNNKDDDGITINSGLSSPTQSTSPMLNLPRNWHKCNQVLFHHLKSLNFLIGDFAVASGPLVLKEINYLQSISKQLSFVSEVFKLINLFEDITVKDVCHKYSGSSTLTNTWEVSATNLQPMYCSPDDMYATFMALFQHVEDGHHIPQNDVKEKVCQIAVDEVMEKSLYGGKQSIISVYQFVDLFKNRLRTHNVIGYLKDLQQELFCFTSLISKDDMIVMTMLQQPRMIPVVQPCVYQLLAMTGNAKSSTKTAVFNALLRVKDVSEENSQKLTEILFQCIEEKNAILRSAACLVLGRLKIHKASKHLMYISQHDEAPLVQDAASKALAELGYSYHSSHG